ncbi:MAG: hypothetical protein VYB54_03545 [Pseudomonadota bacterium]|nr:hypothetical protein [Pseudomonadota bacterium]
MMFRCFVVLFALLAGGAVHAQAATPPSPAAAQDGEKVYDATTLNPAQIRACLKLDQQMLEQEARVADYEKTLSGYREKIAALRAELTERRKAIDAADPVAVNDFNSRVDRHREMTETYNDQFVPALEKRRQRMNELVGSYNERCANKGYFEEDWTAALAELGLPDPRRRAAGR